MKKDVLELAELRPRPRRHRKAKPAYRCTGCGRETSDPDEDLRELRARGAISCCPEREMVVDRRNRVRRLERVEGKPRASLLKLALRVEAEAEALRDTIRDKGGTTRDNATELLLIAAAVDLDRACSIIRAAHHRQILSTGPKPRKSQAKEKRI